MQHEHDDTLRQALRRARILKVDDSGTQQKVNLGVMSKERPEKIVRILPHGFSSHPPKESEGVFLQMGGRSDRSLFLGGEHKDKRPKDLKEGEAKLYDADGNIIYMQGDKGIHAHAKKGEVEIHSDNDKVWVKPGDGKNVYLGGDGTDGTYARVMTEAGPAINVYARVS